MVFVFSRRREGERMKLKIYVGCALTSAPKEFKADVVELKRKLSTLEGVEVLEFLGLTAGTAHDVYVHDIVNCVGRSDIMVAICDYPSTGLGWEMATQVARGKTLLAFGHHESKITRLVLDPQLPGYSFTRYDHFDEIFEVVKDAVVMEMARKVVSSVR